MKANFKYFFLTVVLVSLSWFTFKGLQASPAIRMVPYSSMANAYGGAFLLYAGKFGGEVRKSEIASQRDLAVDGCAKGSKIFKYTLVVTKGNQTFTYQATSNELTEEMLSKLKSLSTGDSFEFNQIKAYLPGGKEIVDVHSKKFIVV